MKTTILAAAVMASSLLSSGCAVQAVKPWERAHLADPRMQPGAPTLGEDVDTQVYFSKEASRGGKGIGGGGCGCN